MVKHTEIISRLLPTNYLSVFDHFVELALKGLIYCLFEATDSYKKNFHQNELRVSRIK